MQIKNSDFINCLLGQNSSKGADLTMNSKWEKLIKVQAELEVYEWISEASPEKQAGLATELHKLKQKLSDLFLERD